MKKFILAVFIGFLIYFFYREEAPIERKITLPKQKITTKVEEVKITRTKKKKTSLKKKISSKKRSSPAFEKEEKRDETFVEVDQKGNMLVTSVFIDGKYVVYQGDILVTDKDTFFKKGMDKKPLVVGKPKLWPGGKIPYVIEPGLKNLKEVKEALEYLNKFTDVEFVPRKDELGYVEFKQGENNCYAHLGYKEKKRLVVLEKNCGKREILHELLHVLGFYHEQCREDRDNHLIVIWDNIDEKFHPQFRKIPMGLTHIKGSKFDFQSIMLYGPSFFSRYPGEYTMTTVSGEIYKGNTLKKLSRDDIIKINTSY